MQFTLITSEKPNRLSKRFFLSKNGTLEKQTAGQLMEGKFQVMNYRTAKDFAELLEDLQPKEALCYGSPAKKSGRLLSKKNGIVNL